MTGLPLSLAFERKPDERVTVFDLGDGKPSLSFAAAGLSIGAKLGADDPLNVGLYLNDVNLKLGEDICGLLAEVAGDGLSKGVTINRIGLRWEGGKAKLDTGGTELLIPLGIKVGPLEFQTFRGTLGLSSSDGLILGALFDIGVDIASGISASIERAGVSFSLKPTGSGNTPAFPVDLRKPTGGGLAINLPIIKGGGFLSIDENAGQYAAVFTARLLAVGVTLTGIVNTKPQLSVLAIASADFRPWGIELSFGFTLNAVGGLIGVGRGFDRQALSEAVRNGAIDSIMFPTNPIANAPRIIADLGRCFPAVSGSMVIAPMLELGWGKPAGMIAVRAALILQLPDPAIAVLGSFILELPPGAGKSGLISLKANFVGGIDPARGLIYFDASLVDSYILFGTIEGDFVLRFKYGNHPEFLVSAGGFFPRWAPPAGLDVPQMRRLKVGISGIPGVELRMESYYAASSNTLQHGSALHVALGIDGYGIAGQLAYDVIVNFDPFSFRADIAAKLGVELFGEEILSVDVSGQLTGPQPLRLTARGRFDFLIDEIEVPIDVVFGNAGGIESSTVSGVELIRKQLEMPGSMRLLPVLAAQNSVVKFRRGVETSAAVPPESAIAFQQNAMPLGIRIASIGNAKASDGTLFDIKPNDPGGLEPSDANDKFSPAAFFGLSEAEKLSRAAFDDFKCGIKLASSGLPHFSAHAGGDADFETKIIGRSNRRVKFLSIKLADTVSALLTNRALQDASLPRFEIKQEQYILSDRYAGGVQESAGMSATAAMTSLYEKAGNMILLSSFDAPESVL